MATITLTIPDALLAVYQRFQQENGAAWADSYLAQKLKELEDRFEAADIAALRAGMADAATRARVRSRLGL